MMMICFLLACLGYLHQLVVVVVAVEEGLLLIDHPCGWTTSHVEEILECNAIREYNMQHSSDIRYMIQ